MSEAPKRERSTAERLADWRAAGRDTVAAREAAEAAGRVLAAATVAADAAGAVEAAAVRATEALELARTSAIRAQEAAKQAADAARVALVTAQKDDARASMPCPMPRRQRIPHGTRITQPRSTTAVGASLALVRFQDAPSRSQPREVLRQLVPGPPHSFAGTVGGFAGGRHHLLRDGSNHPAVDVGTDTVGLEPHRVTHEPNGQVGGPKRILPRIDTITGAFVIGHVAIVALPARRTGASAGVVRYGRAAVGAGSPAESGSPAEFRPLSTLSPSRTTSSKQAA
ncbi:MAG: hypothetical protein U0667_00180 [Chloroflexota bacterium]